MWFSWKAFHRVDARPRSKLPRSRLRARLLSSHPRLGRFSSKWITSGSFVANVMAGRVTESQRASVAGITVWPEPQLRQCPSSNLLFEIVIIGGTRETNKREHSNTCQGRYPRGHLSRGIRTVTMDCIQVALVTESSLLLVSGVRRTREGYVCALGRNIGPNY